jgi:eukaryotic-like serine/threonine-protein kinase
MRRASCSPSGPPEASPEESALDLDIEHRTKRCLTDEQILGFVNAGLGRHEIALVDEHLRQCPVCEALTIEALLLSRKGSLSSIVSVTRGAAFEPKTRVGSRFEIRRFIGHGGMGDVYEAVDRKLSQTVALKMARATVCDDPDSMARLALEVRLARGISHPNVCRVHDVGVHRDTRPADARTGFISMEYIPGESLAQRLSRGPLAPETFDDLAREMLLGLSAIHESGVLHRDIKSHNVMLRDTPRGPLVSIIDFGLAVQARQSTPPPRSYGDRNARPRGLEGSPAYMAPEQFDSVISPASDLFACGVVLFEAITGSLPFRQLGPERAAGARRDPREVPLRAASVASHITDALDAFLARCLDLQPERRYRSAGQALSDLECALRR